MAKGIKVEEFMTGYEKRKYHGYKKTVGDTLKDKQMFKNAVRNRLAMEEQVVLETGEVITVTAAQMLVDAKLEYDLNHPEDINLAQWQKVAGEEVNVNEVNVKGANELFGDIVINK